MSRPRDLTESQWKAVDHADGPLLVLAGPGSGKTRVITRRIARLIEKGIDPRQILAITFTNKAADEMAARVAQLVPGCRTQTSTFHRFCARLLRQYAQNVGLRPNFSIFDTADQRQLVRAVLRDLDIDIVSFPPARIAHRISRAKNDLQSPDDVSLRFDEAIGNHFDAVVARVYPVYQRRLLESNAVDFDDLLLHVVALLNENPELRRQLDERFRYILVDEYQDTNPAQYRIVAALSRDHPNLCVTGDPDQSIYGWRGARIDNILRFESDFPDASVVRLEENFRSTRSILQTADGLIVHNVRRKHKSLVTQNPQGEPVELVVYADGLHEADAIAREIRQLVESGQRTFGDFAVFYRVNALSREIERALVRHKIPYQVAAGVEFYQRAEIKDVLAYLRLIENPDDRIAFARAVNVPRRGIGEKTVARVTDHADGNGLSVLEAAARADQINGLKRQVRTLKSFAALIESFAADALGPVDPLLERVLNETGYLEQWQESEHEQDQQRLENVQELRTAAQQYDRSHGGHATLEGFLETMSLASPGDNLDTRADEALSDSADDRGRGNKMASGRVTLTTLHAAKGLEFPVVYLIGLEQNLIPHERSIRADDRDLEEERRLLFVGITRAKERLVLTQTEQRSFRGRTLSTIPSEFLPELDVTIVNRACDAPVALPVDSERFQERAVQERESCLDDRPIEGEAPDGASPPPADPSNGFAIGMLVRHPQYGLGRVVKTTGTAHRQHVTVLFEDAQEPKTYVSDKCPLQPVGGP